MGKNFFATVLVNKWIAIELIDMEISLEHLYPKDCLLRLQANCIGRDSDEHKVLELTLNFTRRSLRDESDRKIEQKIFKDKVREQYQ